MSTLLLLLVAGAAGGFVAGLVGIGGGVIFGPVLFFVFSGAGVEDPVLTPLTLGTSLLCTLAASASGAVAQLRAGAVDGRTALVAGGLATVAVVLVGRFVTTRPWYDGRVFAAVLGTVLLLVVARMLTQRSGDGGLSTAGAVRTPGRLAAAGLAGGALSALAGVGGGVVLVPLFHGLVRLPLKVAAGTSTASIVLVTLSGVVTYAVLGLGAAVPDGALGYVDWRGSLALAAPAVVAARLGVATAHRVDVRVVRYAFAALAAVAAVRLLWEALG